MPDYKLTIEFAHDQDLEEIRKLGYRTVISKSSASSSGSPVAWLSLDPLMTDVITWAEEYYQYASLTQIQQNATIQEVTYTDQPVAFADENGAGFQYTFENGVWSKPVNVDIPPGSVMALNNGSAANPMTIGLAQEASTSAGGSGLSPINAVPVLETYHDFQTPHTIVSVFMDLVSNNGVVLSRIQSNAATVTFGGDVTEATVNYNNGVWS